jgi:hypothetical protein
VPPSETVTTLSCTVALIAPPSAVCATKSSPSVDTTEPSLCRHTPTERSFALGSTCGGATVVGPAPLEEKEPSARITTRPATTSTPTNTTAAATNGCQRVGWKRLLPPVGGAASAAGCSGGRCSSSVCTAHIMADPRPSLDC